MPKRSSAFLSGGGTMGAKVRAFDWRANELGPIESWSASLHLAVDILLASPFPGCLLWGPDYIIIHNDAYVPILGQKPEALGRTLKAVWGESYDTVVPIADKAMQGEATFLEDFPIPVERHGYPETAYFTFSYSPVRDEGGVPVGVLVTVVETTSKILAQREIAAERQRFAELFEQAPTFMTVLRGPDLVFEFCNPAYYQLVGHRELIGKPVREAIPEAEAQGYFDFLQGVLESGQAFKANGLKIVLQHTPGAPLEVRYLDFVYQPIRGADGRVNGIFVEGVDVTDRTLAQRRQAALVQLTDDIRELEDVGQIAFTASRILGEMFEVSRVGYATIDADAETVTIEEDWTAPGVHKLDRVLHFRDYGSYIENLKRGETVVFADAEKDPRTAHNVEALRSISAISLINMPIMEQGKAVALLYVANATAREWSTEDLSLFYEIAARVRTATERARVTAALRDSEASLRQLNANLEKEAVERSAVGGQFWQISPDLLAVLRGDGSLAQMNPAWHRVLGWTEAEIEVMTIFNLIHPDDIEATWQGVEELVKGNPIRRFENRYRCKNGEYKWFAWSAAPFGDAYYCAGRDITVEKVQADTLAITTAERDRVWQLSRDILVVVGPDGVFRAVNPAWTEILGYELEEVVGHPFQEFLWPDDAKSSQEAFNEAVNNHDLTSYVDRYCHKDGTPRWISWSTSNEGDIVYAYGRDITAERQARDELESMQDLLRQSQKMEAVGQLTGGIAHDFNNMLAVVIGSLDLLDRRIGMEDARAKHYITAATEGAKRAANLTQRLLAFSRQQPLKPEPVNANRLVAAMSELMTHALGGAVQLETVLGAGLWPVHADPNQLENVILNLGVNARDAMPDGGRVTIETQNTHLDSRGVANEPGLAAGQYVMIAVTDTGSGMSPEVIAKAFDPFFTTKEVGKGTGLGLSQVYGFVKQSGGHIKIYSEPGHGTSVKIYLPRYHGLPAEEGTDVDAGILLRGDAHDLILVVDDEAVVRQFSVDALSELGYRTLEADGAKKALLLLETHPDIAMLFTDIVMPDVNGRKLADEAKTRRPDLKVLYTTGYTRNAVVHNGVVDAGVELIGKPFTIDELAAKMREVLDKP